MKYLIIHLDDIGINSGTVVAAKNLLCDGVATSASIIMTGESATEFCTWASNKNFDIGIHSTVTCEWDYRRWTGLTNGKTSFNYNDLTMVKGSDSDIAKISVEDFVHEVKMQIELAKSLGVPLTHLDNHMWTIRANAEMFEAYLKLAKEYNLVAHVPSWIKFNDEMKNVIKKEKPLVVYNSVSINHKDNSTFEEKKQNVLELISNLKHGVSVLTLHPQEHCDIGNKMVDNLTDRYLEYRLFMDEDVKWHLKKEKINLIGWADTFNYNERCITND